MKLNTKVVLPYLVRTSDTWYVEYRCYYPYTNKLERFRHYKGFSKLKTEPEKLALAEYLISDYKTKLKSGWRPWSDEEFIYHDETEYRNSLFAGSMRQDKNHIRKYLSEFLLHIKSGLSPKSYESYQSKTRLFSQWLEFKGYAGLRLFEITNDIVKEFFTYLIDGRKLDKITIMKYRQNLGAMFRYFKDKKLIEVVPMDDLPKARKTKDLAARPINGPDLKKLLHQIGKEDPQLLLACLFQYYLATRPGSEMRLIRIQDVDLYNNKVVITDENAKGVRRTIDMPEQLVTLCRAQGIENYPREFYIFGREHNPGPVALGKNTLRNRFNVFRKELKLPTIYKFYSLKHSGGGALLESGVTIEELKNHFGHASIESTDHYIKRHFGNRNQKIISEFPDPMK